MSAVRATSMRKSFGRDRHRSPPSPPARLVLPPASHGGERREPARLLLAEDEPLHRRMIRLVLASPDVHVTEVETGEAAIQVLSVKRFDLLLLDVTLPLGTGPETLAWLRRGPAQWRDIPVLGLVAAEEEGWVSPMRALGMDEWTSKPVDRTDLMARIRRLLPGLPELAG